MYSVLRTPYALSLGRIRSQPIAARPLRLANAVCIRVQINAIWECSLSCLGETTSLYSYLADFLLHCTQGRDKVALSRHHSNQETNTKVVGVLRTA